MEIKYVEDSKLNKKVAEIIEELKEEIVHRFHPESIIISGSFGRGEAVVFEENGKLKFLSDCEVILIPYKWIFNRKKLDEFEQEFYQKTGLKVEIWGFTPTLYLTLPFLKKKIKPTIANYDLKYGSKVIYGKNYLDKIPNFKPEDIPLWEGIKLILNRMAEALEYFSVENPAEKMIFWTDKIVLACQDALLLSLRTYHPSYKLRNKMLQRLFPNHFRQIENECPYFVELTIKATNRKLKGIPFTGDPIKYWFDVAKACDVVFRYVIKVDMGMTFTDYLEFQEKFLSHPKVKYYQSLLPLHRRIHHLLKMKKLSFKSPRIYRNKLRAIEVYSLIPLLYFALSREVDVNVDYLVRCIEKTISSKIVSKEDLSNQNNLLKYWELIKKYILELWHHIRL